MSSYRVLLIGLDGATFDLLRPWADAGHLPHLGRLMAEGASGPLASTLIPQTPPAWTSMVTGVHPGKHGVFGFVKRRPGTYEKEYPTSQDRGREALWDLLGRVGKRSIIFDLPLSYPPEPLNGIMITGLGTPGAASGFVWPGELKDTIIGSFGPYEFDIYFSGDVQRFIDDAIRVTTHRIAVARYLLGTHPWDFLMVILTTPDRLQHVVWKYVDERHPHYDPQEAARYWPAIRQFYQLIDQAIGDLTAFADDQTAVILASDHGFGPVHTKVSLSRWLVAEGFVTLGEGSWTLRPSGEDSSSSTSSTRGGGRVECRSDTGWTFRVSASSDFAGLVLEVPGVKPTSSYEVRALVTHASPGARLELKDLSRPAELIIGGGSLDGGPQEVSAVFQPQADPVRLMLAMTTYGGNPCGHFTVSAVTVTELEDWTRTSAYTLEVGEAGESRRIRINLQGREPHGVVPPGPAYERLRDEMTAKLQALRDASSGRPLVAGIYRDEEVFPGPCRGDAADLVVLFGEGVGGMSTQGRPDYAGPISYAALEGLSGRHEKTGILLVSGPPIRPGASIRADIVDLCPTILHLLDVPVPHDLDGRVLWEIFTPEFQGGRPVRVAMPVTAPLRTRSRADGYTDEQRQRVEERLRRLGYL
jgi:predicted AlkP superfamily phosphohydrolase/phosphomutase